MTAPAAKPAPTDLPPLSDLQKAAIVALARAAAARQLRAREIPR